MRFNKENVTMEEMGSFAQKVVVAISRYRWKIATVTAHSHIDVTVEIEDVGSFSICSHIGSTVCFYKYEQKAGVPFRLKPSLTSQSLDDMISAMYDQLAYNAHQQETFYKRLLGVS